MRAVSHGFKIFCLQYQKGNGEAASDGGLQRSYLDERVWNRDEFKQRDLPGANYFGPRRCYARPFGIAPSVCVQEILMLSIAGLIFIDEGPAFAASYLAQESQQAIIRTKYLLPSFSSTTTEINVRNCSLVYLCRLCLGLEDHATKMVKASGLYI